MISILIKSKKRRRIVIRVFIIVGLIALGAIASLIVSRLATQPEKRTPPVSTPMPLGILETSYSESIICNNVTYLFESASIPTKVGIETFITDVYSLQTNGDKKFVTRLIPPQQEILYAGKKYATRWIFIPLSVPSANCDRIYLTSRLFIAHHLPPTGIYVWPIDAQLVKELKVSEEFRSGRTSGIDSEGHIPYISFGGERILVAQREIPASKREFCGFRLLRLLDLRQDVAKTIVTLPHGETFEDDIGDIDPGCEGFNFGWLEDYSIYYDVYDATIERNRPLIERRTLVIQ